MAARKTTKRRKTGSKSLMNKSNLIKAGGLVAGGLLAYNAFGKKKVVLPGNTGPSNDMNLDYSEGKTSIPPISSNTAFPLVIGSKGTYVANLQKALLAWGGAARDYIQRTSMRSNGNVDGIFGSGTKAAVIAAGLPYPVTQNAYNAMV
jgi:peptidoglycan hydrolase-like protein with peptidoglycan-binding domain